VNQSIQSATGTRRPRNLSQMRANEAKAAAAQPRQPTPQEAYYIKWLETNADHPSADTIRKGLKAKGLL
jgi:hypothetical protein